MIEALEKEATEDQEIYDNIVCWCTTNDKEKVKSIDDAEAHIEDLTSEIGDLSALAARLNTELETLGKEIAKNQEALEKAKAMREKELAEFGAMESETMTNIDQLGGAIAALAKNHAAALLQPTLLLQTSGTQLRSSTSIQQQLAQLRNAAAVAQRVMQKNAPLLDTIL